MAKKENTPKENGTVAAKAAQKVARDILTSNTDLTEVHVTSDGTAFFTRNDAQNHANTLKNREVSSFKRTALLGATPTISMEESGGNNDESENPEK